MWIQHLSTLFRVVTSRNSRSLPATSMAALQVSRHLLHRCIIPSTAQLLLRRNKQLMSYTYCQSVLHKLRSSGWSAELNRRQIHCGVTLLGKKPVKRTKEKDSAQNEVDAILSAQSAIKIESFAVQLLDEQGTDIGVMKKRLAEHRAKDDGLKLVCIDRHKKPNVYQLMTSADQVKFDKEQRRLKKAHVPKEQKTVRFTMGITKRDLDMKLGNVDEWITKGHNVFISMKSKRGFSQDDVNVIQAQVMEELIDRFGGKVTVKQALKTNSDLKVLLQPEAPSPLEKDSSEE